MSGGEPGDVLIMQAAHARLERELAPWRDALLLMDDAGTVTRATGGAAVRDPRPAGAWYGPDVWYSPAAAAFLDCAHNSPSLRWLQAGTAGVDAAVYAPFLRRGIAVTTSHGFAPGMADQVMAGVLDHWQRGPERRRLRAGGKWQPTPFRELAGSRWLIIGFGAVGREVARRAAAFGAQVTGVARTAGTDALAGRIVPLGALHAELPAADVVILSIALNAATRGMADAAFFAAMKPGATLVNVGRGALVDEGALLDGLARGQPGHAVLDVFVQEPLPSGSPFWTHPAVTMTPHDSWASAGATSNNDATFAANLGRFLAGLPLQGVAVPEDAR
ncbi:NAD(P)-dependent oxidoreductase [Sphingomonas canadensis]|uniref:NAD(P)-dependent oxidoreductase n=1 Tax=Sphingomonas canadensis TaxID=1219257 RepID=A0ABW3HDP9_9SPHN|nr:NAD(P)-dependent oxidoreductase [Sphingomonas canadensis]MCW3838348.1 hypothetical protein [Sphingomonas canadensis]